MLEMLTAELPKFESVIWAVVPSTVELTPTGLKKSADESVVTSSPAAAGAILATKAG